MDPDSKRPPSRLRRYGEAGPPSRTSRGEGRGLRVTVTDGTGGAVRDGGLARWLSGVAPPSARGEVAIALVSDARMRTLNRSYRRKDYATDILSFPADAASAAAGPRSSNPAALIPDAVLGDLVIATGVARRQAREAGHSYQSELRVLALHGLLHLLGYDHDDPDDRGRMKRVERRLRKQGGLTVGLIQRTGEYERAAPGARARRRSGVPPKRRRRAGGKT